MIIFLGHCFVGNTNVQYTIFYYNVFQTLFNISFYFTVEKCSILSTHRVGNKYRLQVTKQLYRPQGVKALKTVINSSSVFISVAKTASNV